MKRDKVLADVLEALDAEVALSLSPLNGLNGGDGDGLSMLMYAMLDAADFESWSRDAIAELLTLLVRLAPAATLEQVAGAAADKLRSVHEVRMCMQLDEELGLDRRGGQEVQSSIEQMSEAERAGLLERSFAAERALLERWAQVVAATKALRTASRRGPNSRPSIEGEAAAEVAAS